MQAKLKHLVRRVLRYADYLLVQLAERIPDYPVHILERQGNWITCRVDGLLWRLDPTQYVDGQILKHGIFEDKSIRWVRQFVKPGMVVADVGANFGYYTVYLSRLVGSNGRVYAFEPSARFRERLVDHLQRNGCSNVIVSEYGLSDHEGTQQLFGDGDSATFHWLDEHTTPSSVEPAQMKTLDCYAEEMNIPRLDFIKVDTDGHESRFVAGATRTTRRFRPVMLLEFAHLNLMAAGSGVDVLARQLADLGYSLCSEQTGEPFASYTDFLCTAMNCSHSVNIICRPNPAEPGNGQNPVAGRQSMPGWSTFFPRR